MHEKTAIENILRRYFESHEWKSIAWEDPVLKSFEAQFKSIRDEIYNYTNFTENMDDDEGRFMMAVDN